MSPSITLLSLTVAATSDINKQRCVGFDGAQASVLGQKVLGVARNDEVSGKIVAIETIGTSIVEVAEPINVGDELTVNADGMAIKPTFDTHHRFADALTAAAKAGDKIEVLLRRS